MSHNNDSGKFFKFKNLQLVRRQNTARQTRQNTDLRMQGTAEEQFAAIAAAACAETDSVETNKSTPEIATDSSLDTSSIEVIQPNEGLAIRLPSNPPQRAPPNSPESPRTNVAVPVPQDLFTEDEETGDDDVPPTETTVPPEVKGRQDT